MSIDLARKFVDNDEYSFIVIKNNEIVYKDKGIGVSPIRRLLSTNKKLLHNSIIVDKIIGKAALMLLIPFDIKFIHANLISNEAIKLLEKENIKYSYNNKCEYIINRTNDGMWPLEKSVLNVSDYNDAYNIIEDTIKILMKKSSIPK